MIQLEEMKKEAQAWIQICMGKEKINSAAAGEFCRRNIKLIEFAEWVLNHDNDRKRYYEMKINKILEEK